MNSNLHRWNNSRDRSGIVLLVTLVLMVVLATLGYTLSSRVASQRHRNQYIIDYSMARYGCDSAVKYALATLETIDPHLISRPNEPDFSDLFYLNEEEYQEILEQWIYELQPAAEQDKNNSSSAVGIGGADKLGDIDYDKNGVIDFIDLGSLTIPGPYGPPWPFVTEPVEFDVGSAKVRIEIEDENAKYPLGWAMLDERAVEREVQAGFEIFCEMAGLDSERVDILREELNEIGQIRPFDVSFKTITRTVKTPVKTPVGRTGKTRATKDTRTRMVRKTVPVSEQITEQTTHFSKVFHSSLLDTESLAIPTVVRSDAIESPLKYMGLWGTMKVNINTAPRHVLEAAFIFGGDEVEIAEEIIQRRRIEPFKDIQQLHKELYKYSNAIGKCEKYITVSSRFFTIRVTAVSGVAKASSVIAITKDGDKVQRIALING